MKLIKTLMSKVSNNKTIKINTIQIKIKNNLLKKIIILIN